ncbi:MAG: hypothetical protein LBE67_07140 [Kocuria palustris]|nr:hypothetical protein [Kocuria palustris]
MTSTTMRATGTPRDAGLMCGAARQRRQRRVSARTGAARRRLPERFRVYPRCADGAHGGDRRLSAQAGAA